MITDNEFYKAFTSRNGTNVDYGCICADLYFEAKDERLALNNINLDRAKFLGFFDMDNGIWLFPWWYKPHLIEGADYVGHDGGEWIYDTKADTQALDATGDFYIFGVKFDENGEIL